jgi:hypothetical protein
MSAPPTSRRDADAPQGPRRHIATRSEAAVAYEHLEGLVDRHGPESAARQWAGSLDADAARALAAAWALVAARRLARAQAAARQSWEDGA